MGSFGTLLVTAIPFGYGPAAKAIALAERLRGDWRVVFAGRGAALDLVRRAPGAFDEVIGGEDAAARAAPAADAVLSVMDRDGATAATRAGKPLFVVDSLLWMRAVVPEPLRAARAYWAQAFPGLTAEDHEPRPVVVGPIVSRRAPCADPPSPRRGLVVNLGGSAAPDDRRALYAAYARAAARAVLEAGLLDRFGEVTVLGGEGGAAAAAAVLRDPRARVETLPHADARRRTSLAAAVLTAPGLTATLECFEAGVPVWFLPPQNTSQWGILRRLRRAGVAGGSFHWEDLPDSPRIPDRVRSEEVDPVVLSAVGRGVDDARALPVLAESLRSVGDDARDRADRQGAFFAALGPDGAGEVARGLARLAEGSAGGRPALR